VVLTNVSSTQQSGLEVLQQIPEGAVPVAADGGK
jgi:hypothetical protein